jgi:hypothetical protein
MTHGSIGGLRRQALGTAPAATRALSPGDRPQGRQ